jgi:23S rRNA (uracil1939-C5)-methyltransferase
MSSRLELTIERPVAGGRMLARHEGRVVLVAGAIPGERVVARVTRVSGHVTFADAVEIVDASPDRRTPAGDPACGGAAYAFIAYPRQLALKSEVIADAFRRIGKHALDRPVAVAPSPETGYRLRARLHVRGRQAGFFREGTHQLCAAGPTGQLLPETQSAIDQTLVALDERLAEVDALLVAENVDATERVVHVEPKPGARLDDVAGLSPLPAGVTGLTTVTHGRLTALAGMAMVTDAAFGLTRRAPSFFQANRHLVGDLVVRVLSAVTGDRFLDLYAGVGLFAVALARRGGQGLAAEGDRWSGEDLETNARPLRDRLRVFRGSVEEAVARPLDPPPDTVIVDPPRTGVSPEALAGALAWRAPKLVYVSCDPATLARDAARILAAGYHLASLEAFDLFPNTPHVEMLAVFER